MATFTYGGNSYTFPGNSGVFLCSIMAVGGRRHAVNSGAPEVPSHEEA
jgi:hypothetical protein